MKKVLLVLVTAVGMTTVSMAQKGNNQVGVALEVGLPTGDFGDGAKTGFGGSVKGMFGIGQAGHITFTTGYTSFGAKDLPAGIKASFNIIPLVAGYRHSFNGFYVEPQIGYGIYGAKMSIDGGESSSSSDGAFTWAAGVGYVMQGLDFGVRYQSASKDGSTISMMGLHVGYNFSLGGNSKK